MRIVVKRQPMQGPLGLVYFVQGRYVSADDAADVAVISEEKPDSCGWWEVPLPPCPDCGGDLVWWEAGYVPGTRKCLGQPEGHEDGLPLYDQDGGCGSLFTVESMPDELTSVQAAEAFGLSPSTTRNAAAAGKVSGAYPDTTRTGTINPPWVATEAAWREWAATIRPRKRINEEA